MAVTNPLQYLVNGVIENTPIGQTTPAAGTFTTLTANSTAQFGKSSANYWQATGGATTKGIQFQALGTDTNISQVFQSKGTGAIDLAAGSSGVNISNGGTVTAITRTATGSSYTGFPSVAITAPTTAGGVQATANAQLTTGNATIISGGTGYTVNDVLTVTTAGASSTISITVTAVSGGVITAATPSSGALTTIPSGTLSVSGGTGTGATFTLVYVVAAVIIITNAGSGYVEQPTVTFSGGGGSGAAAYATVGSGTVIRALGATGTQSLDFYTPSSTSGGVPALRIRDTTNDSYSMLQGGIGFTAIIAQGNAGSSMNIASNGSGLLTLNTGGTSLTRQFAVAHTASAVNYVQVTGSATGAGASALASIQFTGSDASVNAAFVAKGTGYIAFAGGGSTSNQAFRVNTSNASNTGNLIAVQGAVAGSTPSLSVVSGASGTDANIDLALITKGTGVVQFGTYTASILTPTGYITIKDSGGTTRRVLIG